MPPRTIRQSLIKILLLAVGIASPLVVHANESSAAVPTMIQPPVNTIDKHNLPRLVPINAKLPSPAEVAKQRLATLENKPVEEDESSTTGAITPPTTPNTAATGLVISVSEPIATTANHEDQAAIAMPEPITATERPTIRSTESSAAAPNMVVIMPTTTEVQPVSAALNTTISSPVTSAAVSTAQELQPAATMSNTATGSLPIATTTDPLPTSAASTTVMELAPPALDAAEKNEEHKALLIRSIDNYWQERIAAYALAHGWKDHRVTIKTTLPPAVVKLPQCNSPLIYKDNDGMPVGRQRLRVRCDDQRGWMFAALSQIEIQMPLLVLTHSVVKQQPLVGSDLRWEQYKLNSTLHDVVLDPERIIGHSPVRNLSIGIPIRARYLAPNLLVRKGDKVRVKAAEAGFSITIDAVAMEDGQKGERIDVQNPSSGKIISATVVSQGELTIP